MHITKTKWKSSNGKVYDTATLRETYREGGKVKKRSIANLTHCPKEVIEAIELALKHKEDLTVLKSLKEISLQEGRSIGAVYAIMQIAKELGIKTALGNDFQGKLALWQVIARVIDQGSRLSAVRLAQHHLCELLEFERGFNEDDLYSNLDFLAEHQEQIENRLFQTRYSDTPQLFLYDVTSSYLEGECNELAEYGYNRDKKKGKKQIVIGLLTDAKGDPVSTEVFRGNTQDLTTFSSQVKKAAERFCCSSVTFVGDRGMIKSTQIAGIKEAEFHYITAITKRQIETLVRSGVLQMEFFDEKLFEVVNENVRYICKKNPVRASELSASRKKKQDAIVKQIAIKNEYLQAHPKASPEKAKKIIEKRIEKLLVNGWLSVEIIERNLVLKKNLEVLEELSKFDGCYVIKTDLLDEIQASVIVERYKDLAQVEKAFRDSKSTLELRPIFVRTEKRTRGHALIVMLAYIILRELRARWKELNITPEEGLEHLKTLCVIEVAIKTGEGNCIKVPVPRKMSQTLLDKLSIKLPSILPLQKIHVGTRKKLELERK